MQCEMQEPHFKKIKKNKYNSSTYYGLKKKITRCSCLPNSNCDTGCINRSLFYECDERKCRCGEKCTNRTIQTSSNVPLEIFSADNKGLGVRTKSDIKSGSFIIEYVGEVISESEFKERIETRYSNDIHDYCVYLEDGVVIDARNMGNESRLMNHSCQPNCAVEKWVVKGLPCMAIFSCRDISAGEELTFDYKFQSYSDEEKICHCKAENCRGVLGKKVHLEVYTANMMILLISQLF